MEFTLKFATINGTGKIVQYNAATIVKTRRVVIYMVNVPMAVDMAGRERTVHKVHLLSFLQHVENCSREMQGDGINLDTFSEHLTFYV